MRVQQAPLRSQLLPAVALSLLLNTGCAQLPIQVLRFPNQMAEASLSLQVAEANQPGTFQISGSTNLPDRTQLTVAAVRYLYPTDSMVLNPDPTYAILDYQATQVSQGKWQTQLNLWKVASDGRYQESWQIDQEQLDLSLKPAEEIVFIATLAPIDKLPRLEHQLGRRGMKLASGMVKNALDGQRYAQVSQQMAIALPSGRTTPAAARPEDINFGWGYRYLIPKEPQNPTNLELPENRQTNAPPAPEAFLQ